MRSTTNGWGKENERERKEIKVSRANKYHQTEYLCLYFYGLPIVI